MLSAFWVNKNVIKRLLNQLLSKASIRDATGEGKSLCEGNFYIGIIDAMTALKSDKGL